jgi:hypothetical protein
MQLLSIGSALIGISSSSHNISNTKPSNQPHDHDKGKDKYILTFDLLAVWQVKKTKFSIYFPAQVMKEINLKLPGQALDNLTFCCSYPWHIHNSHES